MMNKKVTITVILVFQVIFTNTEAERSKLERADHPLHKVYNPRYHRLLMQMCNKDVDW